MRDAARVVGVSECQDETELARFMARALRERLNEQTLIAYHSTKSISGLLAPCKRPHLANVILLMSLMHSHVSDMRTRYEATQTRKRCVRPVASIREEPTHRLNSRLFF